jgi:hypothetical protein
MDQALAFLANLIGQFRRLETLSRTNDDDFDREFIRWRLSAGKVLNRLGMDDLAGEFASVIEQRTHPAHQLPYLGGILESAQECIFNGIVGKLRHLLHAEMFGSTTEQAKDLLAAGHKIPAAVLMRIVIEGWLRDEGEKAGIPDWDKGPVSRVNDALRNAKVFAMLKWRQIQSLLDIGNAAAHGKADEFTEADVSRMVDFAEVNCSA